MARLQQYLKDGPAKTIIGLGTIIISLALMIKEEITRPKYRFVNREVANPHVTQPRVTEK